jgi:hypothetical protein
MVFREGKRPKPDFAFEASWSGRSPDRFEPPVTAEHFGSR